MSERGRRLDAAALARTIGEMAGRVIAHALRQVLDEMHRAQLAAIRDASAQVAMVLDRRCYAERAPDWAQFQTERARQMNAPIFH